MDKIVLKSNLVSNLLGKKEVTLEELEDIDNLLLDGSGIDFSDEEIENIKHDLKYIFKENSMEISFVNCPDIIREHIIKYAPIEDVRFEGYEEFLDELKANKVSVSEELGKYFGGDSELTEYEVCDLLKAYESINSEIIITMQDLDLAKKYTNSDFIKVKVESLEEYEKAISLLANEPEATIIINKDIMQQIIDGNASILSTTNILLRVESMTEVTPEQLNHPNIENIYVSYGTNCIDECYSIEDFVELQSKLNEILSQVDQSLPELDRFMKIYEILGKKIEYEYDENGEPAGRREAHNLKGGLLENTCVCEGYAKILYQALKCNGIECKYISGEGISQQSHAWNQVKIDGQWYNCDLTADHELLIYNMPLDYCLQSDEEFIEHTPESIDVEKCNSTYNRNKLHSALSYAVPFEFEQKEYSIDEVMNLLKDAESYSFKELRILIDMDESTKDCYLDICNIVSDNDFKWSNNKVLFRDFPAFMQAYTYSYSTVDIINEGIGLVRNNAGMDMIVNDRLKQLLLEYDMDLDILYTIATGEEHATIDTEQLGSQTLEQQKDTTAKDNVVKDMNEQMQIGKLPPKAKS